MFYVGLPKTGSTSLAELFRHHRSGHEFQFEAMADRLAAGEPLEAALRERDAAGLELDSATFHHYYISELARLHPEAKFLLGLRDPASWLASAIGMMVRNRRRYGAGPIPAWQVRLGRRMFGSYDPEVFASDEALGAALPEFVEIYLKFWSDRTVESLSALPADRSRVFTTAQLSDSLPALAAFAGVPATSLDPGRHHENRGETRIPLQDWLDNSWFSDRIREAEGNIATRLGGVPHLR